MLNGSKLDEWNVVSYTLTYIHTYIYRGLTLCPVGLTGPQIEDETVEVDDGEVSRMRMM